jgi:hypothetical protein
MNKKPVSLLVLITVFLIVLFSGVSLLQPTYAADDMKMAKPPVYGELPTMLEMVGGPQVFIPFIVQSCPLPLRPEEWLAYVNFYRGTADLFEVAENTAWSCGNVLHGRYMVKNDIQEHDEDPGNPWYTPSGQTAAMSSNLATSSDVNETDEFAIEAFMQAPFHAVGVLDPRLYTVGFGSYREADGGFQMGAGLDVIQGLGVISDTIAFPIAWPTEGAVIPLTLHWGEYPSPLSSCAGYTLPSGLPIILQIGPGDVTPDVAASSFKENGVEVDHCVFDETNYINPDPAAQDLARLILGARDAIVLVPKNPLTPGAAYSVSITTNGSTYSWSFEVSGAAATAVPANAYMSQVASP